MTANAAGFWDTAVGAFALSANNVGFANTAIGYNTLGSLIAGFGDIALGVNAGNSLTNGDGNIYIGNSGLASESDTIRTSARLSPTAYIAGNVGLGGSHSPTNAGA